ncbi:hypothetical protein NDU88_009538 [Pleurodeles waltl]|uniref:Helix-turn-helix domain-containing protein n=1 Tax=Pleurodeles waltl TaxID=8319 RepID=A0AAV7QUV3_PLEWA|nr:hypothetical protein NDU88_009538 [Pleurodeles waltl]
MGSTFAPSLACLYVDHFEKEMVLTEENPYFNHIRLWKRYIDDIMIIWRGTREEATIFITWLNTLNPFLRFTATMGDPAVSFLDLLITERNGSLVTEVFYKPTDRNTLLQFQSFHPRSLRENLPVGQYLHLRRNCTELTDYKKHAQQLTNKLRARGYPDHLLRRADKRVLVSPRETLLHPSSRTSKRDPLICVTTFNPASNMIKKILNEDWKILTSGGLPFQIPMNAYKKAKSIRDMIVHTRPWVNPTTSKQRTLWDLPPPKGHFPCGSCSVCAFTKKTLTLDLGLETPWELRQLTNCNSKNVVYMITCPCDKRYIGMMTRRVGTRICEHRSTIRCKRDATRLTEHYISSNHHPDHMQWVVLDQLKTTTTNAKQKLLLYEQRWIWRLQTDTRGLNDNIQWSALG